MYANTSESKVNRMIGKKQLIAFVMLVALTVFGVLNLDTVRLSAYESPAIYTSPAYVSAVEAIGTNYTFSVETDYGGDDVWGFAFDLTYNPNVLEWAEAVNGDLINELIMWVEEFNNTEGTLHVSNSFYTGSGAPPVTSGPGTLADIAFTVVGYGTSNITFVERATRLVGYNDTAEEKYNIVDDTPMGHIEGSVLDSSSSQDVFVADVSPHKTVVCQGLTMRIDVTVENQGTSAETNIDVTVKANDTVVDTTTIPSLDPDTNTALTFTWDATGFAKGAYTISARAADHTLVDGTVIVSYPGDINGPGEVPDGLVDIDDVIFIAIRFGSVPEWPIWDPIADVTDDDLVDIDDVIFSALRFGQFDP